MVKRKAKFPTPKLVPLDLSLCTIDRNNRGHPDLNKEDTYLVLFDGQYFAGKFSAAWFGWNFEGWYAPLQFDPPGYNSSRWQQIWKIVGPKPKKVKFPEDRCEVKGCKGRLKRLKTTYGDPEGIRADLECRKCGIIHGCTKATIYALSKAEMRERESDLELT